MIQSLGSAAAELDMLFFLGEETDAPAPPCCTGPSGEDSERCV